MLASRAAADVVRPAEGAVLNYLHVPFRWPAVADVSSYELQIVVNDGSADPFADAPLAVHAIIDSDEPRTVVTSGLDWAQSYAWRVRGIDDGPLAWGPTHLFQTVALPAYMPDINITLGDGDRVPEPGVTLFNIRSPSGLIPGGVVLAVDLAGNIIWWLNHPAGTSDLRLLHNGRILYLGGNSAIEATLGGQATWTSPPADAAHHEVFPMPGGNYLTLVPTSQTVIQNGQPQTWVGDFLREYDRHTNAVVWQWNEFDYWSTLDFDPLVGGDWTHTNAVVYNLTDNSVYVSARHLSRITRIDYTTKDIIYNMGFNMPSGDVDFGDNLFSFQHAPDLLPNGHMMVFDNGNRRDHIVQTPQTGVSKAIELAFTGDPPTNASIVWEWTVPEYCSFVGDADRLPGDNTLVTAGPAGKIYEVAPDGEQVWRLSLPAGSPSYLIYRADRVPQLILEMPADSDGDWDLDLADYGALQDCFTGPGPAGLTFPCTLSDADGDDDVDLADHAEWYRYISGPM
jgi:hypothetical protein